MRLPVDAPLIEAFSDEWIALAYGLLARDPEGFQRAIASLSPQERVLAIRALNDTASRLQAMMGVCETAARRIKKAGT